MITGTAVAILPTSVSFCMIFLMRPCLGSATQAASVWGDFTHRKKTTTCKRNLCGYSRVESERCIFFSVQAFRSFKYPRAGYILINLTVRCLAFHLFTFHRKSSVWSAERRDVEVIFTGATPTNSRYVMTFLNVELLYIRFCYILCPHCDNSWHSLMMKIHKKSQMYR